MNQWQATFSQPASFQATPPALQSTVIALTPANSVGGGTGTPTAGNWLVVLTGMNEQSVTSGFTVGVKDDTHPYWRPGKVSASAALTRTSVWYTANTQRAPGYVYVSPNGALGAMAVLVLEVSGLGPWDTLSVTPASNYAAAATSLSLSQSAPSAASAVIAAVTGDSTAAGQAFAPAAWTTLHTVSAANGVDHTCDAVLTSAYLPSTSGSVSVSASATSATDLSGVIIEFQINAASPIPGGANAAWPGRVILEAAFGSGFETPEDQMTWTSLNDNAWTSLTDGFKRFWSWADAGGVPYALGQLQSSTGTVQCDNSDGLLSPANPASLFYTSAAGWSPQSSFYDPLVIAQAPAAWWKLADASGASSAADSSGNGRPATATSVTFGNASEAVSGNTSASFASGSTSHALSSYNPALSAVTAEAWVNLNSLSQSGNPLLMANSNTGSDHKGFTLGLTGTTPAVTFGNSTTSASVTAKAALPATGWTYLAATWDGTTVTLYVNGVSQGTASLSGTMPAGTASGIGLGYNPAASSGYLNGLLAECAVYGTALTAAQVAAHYTAGPSGTGVPVRLRAALGTIGGVTCNRWYTIARNALKWPEKRNRALRGFVSLSLTDIWSVVSGPCMTPYRGEVSQDSPYAWWPCDDQPTGGGVLPTSLRNAASGNANVLNITQSPAGAGSLGAGAALPQLYCNEDGWAVSGATVPPASPVYTVAAQQGWMYGDPQSSPASYQTSNPVTSNPGSAAWQNSGQAGTLGSQSWFLSCTDSNFPPLAGGITVECWFSYQFYGSAAGFTPAWTGPGSVSNVTVEPADAPVLQQPTMPLTILELATATAPVAVLQLDSRGHLNLITYSGAAATSNSIYTGSDLRSSSWHHVAAELTATTWTVYVDGGATAAVSGSATGMTSAWTSLIVNGDLGTGGSSSAGVATAFVQSKTGTTASGSSLTVTLDRPTTAGNCLAVCVTTLGAGITVTGVTIGGVADNFASAKAVANPSSGGCAIWVDPNCAGGQTSVVVTASGASSGISAEVMEFSGIVTSSPVDQTASGTGSNVPTWTTGSTATLSVPSEIAIAVVGETTSTTLTGPGASWTNFTSLTGGPTMLAGWAPVSSTAAQAYSGYTNSSSTSITYAAAIVTLKAVGYVHGGNVAVSHLAVYPSRLPAWRVAAHYWAAFTGFGAIPAPGAPSMQWSSGAGTYTPDGSPDLSDGGYQGANGVLASAIVTAVTPGGLTSGPSPRAIASGYFSNATANMWVQWTGVAPLFNVYTAPNPGPETRSAVTAGSGDSFINGYGAGALGEGTGQTSGISLVQWAVPANAITSPVTVPFKRATTAGNCLVACIGTASGSTVTGVTIGGSADHFAAAKAVSGSGQDCAIWVDPNCAGGQTSVVVTVSPAATTSVLIMELSGVAASTPVDQTAGQNASAGGNPVTWTTGATGTLSQTPEIAVGVIAMGTSSGTLTAVTTDPVQFNTFTMRGTNTLAGIAGLSTTAGLSFNGTFSGAGTSYSAAIITLKSTWAGGSPPASASALGDTVQQRIERILAYGRVTAPVRAIDPDASLLVQAARDVGGQQCGGNLQNLVDSDNGLLYVGSDGALHYRSRTHLSADQAAGPVWQIGMNVAAGNYPFDQSITFGNDPQKVFDSIALTPYSPDGASLASLTPANNTGVNSAQTQYGVRPRQVTSYLQDQSKIQSAANWWFAQFGQVTRRIETIRLDAASHPATWPLVLAANCGDIISVYDAPFGAPATTGLYRISSISRTIAYGANGSQPEASAVIVAESLPSSYWS